MGKDAYVNHHLPEIQMAGFSGDLQKYIFKNPTFSQAEDQPQILQ